MRGLFFIRLGMLLGLLVWGQSLLAEEAPAPPLQNVADLPTESIKFRTPPYDMIVAAGGKYLIVQLPLETKLVRVDVAAGKGDKILPIPPIRPLVTASLDKLYLVHPKEGIIERYDLESFERELTAPLPDKFPPLSLTTGHAAKEPLLLVTQVGTQGKMTFLDPTTLEPLALTNASKNKATFHRAPGCPIRVSANGRLFVSKDPSNPGWSTLRLLGNNNYEVAENKTSPGIFSPSADGERVMTSHGIANNEAELPQADKKREERVSYLPSVTGTYQLRLYQGDFSAKEPERRDSTAQFMERGEENPFLTLKLRIPYLRNNEKNQDFTTDKRLLFFPEQKRLVILEGERSDQLKLVKLDIEALPKTRTKPQFEIVAGQVPAAVPGQPWQHQLKINADEPAAVTLSDGPPGMTVSAAGAITWKVPADMPPEVTAILQLKNAKGQELYHNLRIHRHEPTAARTGVAKLSPARFEGESTTLKLPGEARLLIPGGGGRYLVTHLPKLQRLALIDLVEVKVAGYLPLEAADFRFGASADKLLVANNDKKTVTRYSLPDLKEELAVPLELPVSALIIGHASNGPALLFPRRDNGTLFQDIVKGSMFYDLATLEQLRFEFSADQNLWRGHGHDLTSQLIRCSANGKLYCWGEGKTLTVHGEELHFGNKSYLVHDPYFGWPNADGSVLYSNTWRLTPRMQRFETYGQDRTQILIPALEGRLYLSLFRQQDQSGWPTSPEQIADVYLEGSSLPLASLPKRAYLPPQGVLEENQIAELPDRQLAFVPAAKVIVGFGSKRDELNFYRFDLGELLAKGKPPLYVTSVPPQRLEPGEKLNYQILAESRQGGLRYELEQGPPGMTIDAGARVQWTAPPRQPRPAHDHQRVEFDKGGLDQPPKPTPNYEELIKIRVSDNSGQKILHSFSIITGDPDPKDIAAKPKPVEVAAEVPLPAAKPAKPPSLLDQALQSIENFNRLDGNKRTAEPKKAAPRDPERAQPPAPIRDVPQTEKDASARETNATLPTAGKVGITRTWTDAPSGKSIEGVFLGMQDGRVSIRYTNGREVAIPLERLSREDLLWLMQPAAPAKP